MVLQVVLVVGMLACGYFAWDGVDKSQGWKVVTFGALALALLAASCSTGSSGFQGNCDSWGRFASEC